MSSSDLGDTPSSCLDTDEDEDGSEFSFGLDTHSSKSAIIEDESEYEVYTNPVEVKFEDLPFGYRSGAYIDSTVVQSITKSLESKLEHANRFGFSSNDFKETLVLADRLGRYFDTSNQYISNRVREVQALQRKTAVMLDEFRISTYQYTNMIFKLGEELAILKRYTPEEPLELLIRKRVEESRLAVATAFISVLPGFFPSGKLINVFTGDVIWDNFLSCLVARYHSHHAIVRWQRKFEDEEAGNRWIQTKSVFSAIRIDIKGTKLEENVRRELSAQLKHFTPVVGVNLKGSTSRPRNPRLALKFFLPLLIWSYNECKDWIVFLDKCRAGQLPKSPVGQLSEAEVNCSATQATPTVFQSGTAREARRRWKRELERAGGEAALADFHRLIQKSMDLLGVDSADGGTSSLENNRQIQREYGNYSVVLRRFNWIRKCLIILCDDLLLDLLLTNDGAMQRFSREMDFARLGIIEVTRAIGQFDDADRKDIDKERLDRAAEFLHEDMEHIDHALIPAEQIFDSLLLKTIDNLLRNYGPFYLTDYGILFALLDKLDPITDTDSDVNMSSAM